MTRVSYTGNGVADAFSFPFRIDNKAWLEVFARDTDENLYSFDVDVDYTVSGVGVSTGGSILLTDGALASGWSLIIQRTIPLEQTFDMANGGVFDPRQYQDAFDTANMIYQQFDREMGRSLRLASTDESEFDAELPGPMSSNAGKVIAVNGAGDGLEFGPLVSALEVGSGGLAAAEAAAAAALASETAAGVSKTDAETAATTADTAASGVTAPSAAAVAAAAAADGHAIDAATAATGTETDRIAAEASATAAGVSKTAAEAAQTAAEAAQTAAEAAQTAAEAAQTAAEAAETAAELAADTYAMAVGSTITTTGTVADANLIVPVDPTAGSMTVTLPEISVADVGRMYLFKNITASTNNVTITRAGSDTIDGATTQVMNAAYESLWIVASGATTWSIL